MNKKNKKKQKVLTVLGGLTSLLISIILPIFLNYFFKVGLGPTVIQIHIGFGIALWVGFSFLYFAFAKKNAYKAIYWKTYVYVMMFCWILYPFACIILM